MSDVEIDLQAMKINCRKGKYRKEHVIVKVVRRTAQPRSKLLNYVQFLGGNVTLLQMDETNT
jgi:hypothetical protein